MDLSGAGAARRACALGLPLALATAVVDATAGAWPATCAALLLALGCTVSILASRRRAFVVWPAYVSLWLASFPELGPAGGMRAPHFAIYMALLFAAGVVIQRRIGPRVVIAFTLANVAGWAAWQALLSGEPTLAFAGPPGFEEAKAVLYIVGVCACLWSFFRTEEGLRENLRFRDRDLAQSRESLVHAQRLAQMGNLLASTAHELTQPVQALRLQAQFLERKRGGPPLTDAQLARFVQTSLDCTGRMQRLIQRIRDFSRRDLADLKVFDLAASLRAARELIGPGVENQGVTLEIDLPPGPLPVYGDELRVQQIVLNLVANSRDALTDVVAPRIRISVDPSTIPAGAPGSRDRWIRLIVSDNGPGIPLAAQNRIFEPYFTTKRREQGTGLGLSICAQLADEQGARLFFGSDRDGTQFCLQLLAPAAAAPAPAPSLAPALGAASPSGDPARAPIAGLARGGHVKLVPDARPSAPER